MEKMKRYLGLGILLLGVWMGTHAGMAGNREFFLPSKQESAAKVHVSSAETSTGLNDLPLEMLQKIIKYLPKKDQKSFWQFPAFSRVYSSKYHSESYCSDSEDNDPVQK
jgi:hypothetical protein